jgi:hypothetical protein
MLTIYVLSKMVTDLSYTNSFHARRSRIEHGRTGGIIKQWCLPIYGKQSDDYKNFRNRCARFSSPSVTLDKQWLRVVQLTERCFSPTGLACGSSIPLLLIFNNNNTVTYHLNMPVNSPGTESFKLPLLRSLQLKLPNLLV